MGRNKKWKRRNNYSLYEEPTFSQEETDALNHHFQKIYTYCIPKHEQWNICKEAIFKLDGGWQDQKLMELKERLNEVKSQLSDIEINTWHFHTTSMNPAGLIISSVKRDYGPEMCTQAWCKFHEILCNFNLCELDEQQPLNTLHLCEAPGAFIASLNHYIKSRNPDIMWNWLANTLNPHYEGNNQNHMIADDSFIINTLEHWYFGVDNSGNIMKKQNLEDLIQKGNISGKYHLVTADGSIDCANNPAEQESSTSQLHYCELVTALSVLEKGGCLVMKMFTLLEESSISMIYIMCCAFESVAVFKPVTSKPGNSEVYIVCQRYLGLEDDVIQMMQNNFNTEINKSAIFSQDSLPKSYLEQHRQCCFQFCNYQIQTIEGNQRTFNVDQYTSERHSLENEKLCFVQIFKEICKMRGVANSDRIVPFRTQAQNHSRLKENYVLRKPHTGSYIERQRNKDIEWKERVKAMVMFTTDSILDKYPLLLKIDKIELTCNCKEWKVVLGNPCTKIYSSRFCDETLLSLYNGFIENMDFQIASKSDVPSTEEETFKVIMEQFSSRIIKEENKCPATELHIVQGQIEHKEKCFSSNHNHVVKCLQMLQVMKQGDCLLFHQEFSLTRLTVGLHYLLHTLFEKVEFYIPRDGSIACIYILCLNYMCDTDKIGHSDPNSCTNNVVLNKCITQYDEQEIQSFLKNVCEACDELQNDKDKGVLEFVPMRVLYGTPFYTEVCWLNDQLLKRRINYMITCYNNHDIT